MWWFVKAVSRYSLQHHSKLEDSQQIKDSTGFIRLIRIYLHWNTVPIITSKIMKKIAQENCWRAQKVRCHQYQVGQEAQVPVVPWKSKLSKKDKTCRFNDWSILHEAKKPSRSCCRRIKNKDGNRISKSQSQNHRRRGAEIWRDGKLGRFR